jgi:hypothetical protein
MIRAVQCIPRARFLFGSITSRALMHINARFRTQERLPPFLPKRQGPPAHPAEKAECRPFANAMAPVSTKLYTILHPRSNQPYRQDLAVKLGNDVIQAACVLAGHTWCDSGLLTPAAIIHWFLIQILNGYTALTHVP